MGRTSSRTRSPTSLTRADSRLLARLVRRALGARANQLTVPELRGAIARYRSAGKLALQARWGTPVDAARAMQGFADLGAGAARHLADRTRSGHPPVITDPACRAAASIRTAPPPRLVRSKELRAHGVGVRVTGGKVTATPCLTIAVNRKEPLPELHRRGIVPFPRSFRAATGRRVPVDVVEAGPLRLLRRLSPGVSLGPFDRLLRGTLGAFAVNPGGNPVALTAMHVVEPPSDGIVGIPSPQLGPGSARLGERVFGTRSVVDAAALSIDPPNVPLAEIELIGPIRGWRPMIIPGDRNQPVQFVGATSGRQRGFIVEPAVTFPDLDLHDLILVDIRAEEGDSGAGLVDAHGLLLGLLAGEVFWLGFPLIAFCPMSLVLQALGHADVLQSP